MPSAEPPSWAQVTNYVPRRPWLHKRAYLLEERRGTTQPTRKDNMSDTTADPLANARALLKTNLILPPSDLFEDLPPDCLLLWLHDGIEYAAVRCAQDATKVPEGDADAMEIFTGLANGVAMAMVGITKAMVELRLLPTEALEAMQEVNSGTGS